MARSNAGFNRWVVHELAARDPEHAMRIVELGPGPGVGLEETLRVFAEAQLWGVDLSQEMLDQCRRRNLDDVRNGRLHLLQGGTERLADLAPVDIVVAVHVLYFWHRPEVDLARIHGVLGPGGVVALGYRLRQHMPRVSQVTFPKEGHLLYESDDQVSKLLDEAGFRCIEHLVADDQPNARTGHLAVAIV